ncbi:MAG: phosphate ABC transporter permease PstA [Clostridiales bacterium]|nr:phosphate ABC transporter permease PstA [Clostridiales bacterium]
MLSGVVLLALALIVGFILIKGLPAISPAFLFGPSGNAAASLRPAFVTTGLLILTALAVALPIGIGAAIYLSEYAKQNSRIVKVIRLFTETLSGMPSIIFGFFGVIFFCELLGLGRSVLAGGLTLSLIILPTVIRAAEESLLAVGDSLREASLALGAGRLRTIFYVVLPSAVSGIVTAVILGIGRIVGESAALIYTAGAVMYTPQGLLSEGAGFAVMMWKFSGEGLYLDYAYATAATLLLFVAILQALVALCKRGLTRGKRA